MPMRRSATSSPWQSVNGRPVGPRAAASASAVAWALLALAAPGAFAQDPPPAGDAAPAPAPAAAPAAPAAPRANLFTSEPTTPIEFWDAADYLVRTGQHAQAVPYLQRFIQSNP